ncbi:hypothetical protein FQZ97_1126500 [compost metagenome]
MRGQFDFQLAAQQLLFEQGVLANVGSNHLADLPVFQQYAQAKTVDAAIVGNHGQPLHAHAADLGDQVFRDTADAEAAGNYRHVVGESGERLFVAAYAFIESCHVAASCNCRVGPIAENACSFTATHSFVKFVFPIH